MQQRRRLFCSAAIAIVAATLGCGGSSVSTTSPSSNTTTNGAAANTVSIMGLTFSPATMTVSAGSTVTWQWGQCDSSSGGYGGYGACVMHSVTFDDGISSTVQDSGTFSRTFATPGTYKYHCSIHGAAMSGQIIVN